MQTYGYDLPLMGWSAIKHPTTGADTFAISEGAPTGQLYVREADGTLQLYPDNFVFERERTA